MSTRHEEILSRIKKIAERLEKEYHAEKVILFGSYAKGEETVDSDIDLLVVAPTKERFYQRMANVRRLIRDLRYGMPVAPIVLNEQELQKRIRIRDQFVIEILDKGVSL